MGILVHPPKRTLIQRIILALMPRKPLRIHMTIPQILRQVELNTKKAQELKTDDV